MTTKDRYPLPRIDDLFYQFHKATIFSKIDLRLGSHQVRIKDDDIFKRTFRTRYSHYEFLIIPFGLTNTHVSFRCLMNSILRYYQDKFVFFFIDDILIYSKNEQELKEHLTTLLQVLQEQQLYAKFSKCDFFKDKIQYLRNIVPRMES